MPGRALAMKPQAPIFFGDISGLIAVPLGRGRDGTRDGIN